MNFSPYQDTAPESNRELSPPPSRRSPIPNPPDSRTLPHSKDSAFTAAPSLPPPSHFTDDETPQVTAGYDASHVENGRLHVNLFETSLPMRLDYEAMVAYLLLPPAGGVLLLLMEHKSDYVRFHGWQSSLLFTFIFVSPPHNTSIWFKEVIQANDPTPGCSPHIFLVCLPVLDALIHRHRHYRSPLSACLPRRRHLGSFRSAVFRWLGQFLC